MNLAPLRPVDDLYRHELNALARRDECKQLFGFDLELRRVQLNSIQRIEPHQSKSALAVRQFTTRERRQFSTHPTIHDTTHKGHLARLIHSIADNERRRRAFSALQKISNVARRVLSIAIHAQRPGEAALTRKVPSRSQGRPFALRGGVRNHFGAGAAGPFHRRVG
jgi:hypothetical protein